MQNSTLLLLLGSALAMIVYTQAGGIFLKQF